MYDIFYIAKERNKTFLELQKRYPLLKLAKYEDKKREAIFYAQKKTLSKFFWIIDEDFTLDKNFKFEYNIPEWDEKYVHVFKTSGGIYDGLYLIPKKYNITSKESEYFYFVNKKDVDIISGDYYYDQFIIKTSEDYFKAQEESKTSLFYAIDSDFEVIENFKFNIYIPRWDRQIINILKTQDNEYDGIYIIPKEYHITKKESDYNFFINKKEIDIVASKSKKFDIVFISYNEPNADINYEKLKERFPTAKRIHGIKGIHQAHIEAAKLVETKMFWVVDGDAIIEPEFNFDYHVSRWDKDVVHVFRSRNPINDLTYGYGGVKLLPTKLVLNMDVNSVDMTTSISKKFKSVDTVSNITAFNTDPFNTWKSSFRECVKLSSKIINGQLDDETLSRLDIWCNIGADKEFGDFAIKGAVLGREFGIKYSNNTEMLSKINDWEWLKNTFEGV